MPYFFDTGLKFTARAKIRSKVGWDGTSLIVGGGGGGSAPKKDFRSETL